LLRPRGGVEELARALAAALGPRLATGTRARSLERAAGLWRVDSDAGPLEADRVVLALPARAAAHLLERAAPECSAELAGLGAESLVSVVHVWRRERVRHALDGFGYLVPAAAGGAVLGTLFRSSIDPAAAPAELVLLRTLLGGARAPDACRLADEELLSESLRSARPLLGLEGQPEWRDVRRWPEVLPRYDLGHAPRLARIERATPPGLALLGNFAGGIGVGTLVERARELATAHGSPSRSSADRAGSAGATR
jgi:oxygen-dependent protoporphyrinogen oxidase